MPSIRNILAYSLSTLSFVSGYIGESHHCENHGLNMAYERGTGKIGGEPFCSSKIRDGVVINGLECWSDKNSLRGLKFYYSDKSEMMLGVKDDLGSWSVNMKMKWDPAVDYFEHLQLWDNGWDGVIGRIDAKTSNGESINCGKQAKWGAPSVEVDRGAAGMMIGAEGGVGDAIDYIKFKFTKSGPTRVTLKTLDIPALESNQGIQDVSLETLNIINYFENDTLETNDFNWATESEKSRNLNLAETKTFGMGQKLSLSFAMPSGLSFGSDTSMNWETTTTRQEENFDRKKETLSWGIKSLTIQPGKAKVIDIRAIKGELKEAPYNAKMEVTFADHSTFMYDTKATFEILQYKSTTVITRDMDALEAMKNIGTKGNIEVDRDGQKVNKKRMIRFHG